MVYLENKMTNHHLDILLKPENNVTFVGQVWFVFLMQLRCDLELMKSPGKISYRYLSFLLVLGLLCHY